MRSDITIMTIYHLPPLDDPRESILIPLFPSTLVPRLSRCLFHRSVSCPGAHLERMKMVEECGKRGLVAQRRDRSLSGA
jgi:hypothetical protein